MSLHEDQPEDNLRADLVSARGADEADAPSRSGAAAAIVHAKLLSGVSSRAEIMPHLVPSTGIPREEADRLWLSTLYDRGTAKLRNDGIEATSFGGRTFILNDGEMSEEKLEMMRRCKEREEASAEKHKANAERIASYIARSRHKESKDQLLFAEVENG